jgi:putative endonuclease
MELPEELYYVYVLLSMKDMKQCVGYTHNLNLRLEQHEKGLVPSTKERRQLKLIYFEACLNQQDATKREKYFKTHYGRMFLKKRLQNFHNTSNRIPYG